MSLLDREYIIANYLYADKAVLSEMIIEDISGIIIEGVNNSTGTFIKTPLLKTNTIDFSNEDLPYISFISDISSDISAGFVQFNGEDLSAIILEVNDFSVNFIETNENGDSNGYINFMHDVSISNNIKVSVFKTKFLSSIDTSIVIYSDVSSDDKFNIATLVSDNFNNKNTQGNFIEIIEDISTNTHVEALDVSVSNSVKVANDLSLSKIGAYNDIVTFVNDVSINGMVDSRALMVNNIHTLSETQLIVEGDLSINNNLFVKDLSFNGDVFGIDGCLNITGQITFPKTIKAKEATINTIETTDANKKFIFDSPVKIEGRIKAAHKPKKYKAYHSDNYHDLVIELATNYGDGALGLLSEFAGKEAYLKSEFDNFGSEFSLARYDGLDNLSQTTTTATLYVQKKPGSLKKLKTINIPITFGSIKHNKDVVYEGNDISYLLYDTPDSSTNIANVTTDLSCDFSYNRYEMIGLSGGIFYPNTRKNTHYFDFSGIDPEFIDVSYIIGDYHDNSGYAVSIEKYHNPNYDASKTRIVIVTPSVATTVFVPEGVVTRSMDFSLNVAGHDYSNYKIRTIKLTQDQVFEIATRPVWDAIRFKTYDVCLEGMYQHTDNNTGHDIVFTDFSWNDSSLSNPISTADTRDISSAFFDISLNQYFGDNSHNLKYTIDLSGFNVNTKYDVSFNISSVGHLKDRIDLSGNIITVNTCINNDKTLAEFQTDTSLNIVLHNYYDFRSPTRNLLLAEPYMQALVGGDGPDVLLAGAGALNGAGGQGIARASSYHGPAASSSHATKSGGNAFNNSLTTYDSWHSWAHSGASHGGSEWYTDTHITMPQWIDFEFPFDVIITRYKIWPRANSASNPKTWTLYGNYRFDLDHTNYTEIHSKNGEDSWPGAGLPETSISDDINRNEYTVTNTAKAYRSFKLYITNAGASGSTSYVAIGELAFYGYRYYGVQLLAGAGGLDGTGGAEGTAGANSVLNNSYEPTRAFNGTITSVYDIWHSTYVDNLAIPKSLIFVFPYDVIITEYKIWGRLNNASGHNPLAWKLLAYPAERMYPPTRNLTSASHTISGQAYGNGTYVTVQSDTYDTTQHGDGYSAFNESIITGPHFNGDYNNNGYYNVFNGKYLVDDYYGDWITIKLPVQINLTKYGFKQRGSASASMALARAPGQYKIYGSNDGINWSVLVHKTSNITYSGAYFEESISTTVMYNYFGVVVNKLHKSGGNYNNMLNFDEWYIYGNEDGPVELDDKSNQTYWPVPTSDSIENDTDFNLYRLDTTTTTAYRKFELKITDSANPDGAVSISQLAFYGYRSHDVQLLAGGAAVGGGLNGNGGGLQGTARALTSHNDDFPASDAFNGTLTDGQDAWHNTSSTNGGTGVPQWIEFAFPYDVIVTKYKIWPRFKNGTDSYNQSPKNWILQGSTNESPNTWIDIHTQSGINDWPTTTINSISHDTDFNKYDVDNITIAYRAFRLYITAAQTNNYLSIGQLAFYGYPSSMSSMWRYGLYDQRQYTNNFDFVAAGIDANDIGKEQRDLYQIDPYLNYTKDVSRNIVLRVKDIIRNTPPVFTDLSFYGISYEDGQAGWETQFYNDNSFDYSFGNFTDICFNKTDKTTDPSFTYYIWDTSSIRDNSALEYRFDFSAIDNEGFDISFEVSYIADTSMTITPYNENKEIIVTTSGNRDPNEIDTSFSIYAEDKGDFNGDRDCCYNRIELRFHPFLYKFKEFKFTNCDISGRLGPSTADCSDFYTDRFNNGEETYSLDNWWTDNKYLSQTNNNGVQIWTVPATGQYDIRIAGAGGGRSYSYNQKHDNLEGYGARFDTSANLVRGDKYRILIGQKGYLGRRTTINTELATGYSNHLPYSSSGGGATFFVKDSPILDGDIDDLNDIDNLIIAVAGGGSGGRTWTKEGEWGMKRDITDASIDTSIEKFAGNPGLYDKDDKPVRTNIQPDDSAPGRGGGINLNSILSNADIVFGGGGGGGGIIKQGGLAGHDRDNQNLINDANKEIMKSASPFIDGGTGGDNGFSPRYGAIADAIGDAKEGGFGGGGAGGEGGSGGGGGYAGGGSDAHDITTGDNINPNYASYAGGGSSYYSNNVHDPSHNIPDVIGDDKVDGYLHITFNPYNN